MMSGPSRSYWDSLDGVVLREIARSVGMVHGWDGEVIVSCGPRVRARLCLEAEKVYAHCMC